MTAPLHFGSDDTGLLRSHYRGAADDVMDILWRNRRTIAGFITAGIVAAIVAVIVLPPRYTSDAILQVSFSRDEPNGAVRTQRIATIDAVAVVESALRVMRSRALASAVVARLGLADERGCARPSRTLQLIWSARSALGLPLTRPSAHELATQRLMGMVRTNIEPRSYVIAIRVTADHPERAATLANAVAIEYLLGQQVQQLADTQRTIEREIADRSAIYGADHPGSIAAAATLKELQARIAVLREGKITPAAMSALNSEFLPAEPVMIPSGPSRMLTLALMLGLALAACAGLIVLREYRDRPA